MPHTLPNVGIYVPKDYEINWGDSMLSKQDDNGFFYLFDSLLATDHLVSGTYKGRHNTIHIGSTNYYISSSGAARLKSFEIYGTSYTLSNSGLLWCDHLQSTGTDTSYFLGPVEIRDSGDTKITCDTSGITLASDIHMFGTDYFRIYPDYDNFNSNYVEFDTTTDSCIFRSNKQIYILPDGITQAAGLFFDCVSSVEDYIINKKAEYAGVASNLVFKINDDLNGYFGFKYQDTDIIKFKENEIELNQNLICNTDVNIKGLSGIKIYPKWTEFPSNNIGFTASSNTTTITCDEAKLIIDGTDDQGVILKASDGILELIGAGNTKIKSDTEIYLYPDFDSDADMYLGITKDSNSVKISSSSNDALKIYSNTDVSIISDSQVLIYPDLDTRPTNYLKYTAGSGTVTEYCSQALIIDSDDYLALKSDGSTGILSDNNIELYPDFDADADMMLQISKSSNNVRMKSNSSGDGLDLYSNTDLNIINNYRTCLKYGNTDVVYFDSSGQIIKAGMAIIWE